MAICRTLSAVLVSFAVTGHLNAQSPTGTTESPILFNILAAQDSALFDAFNSCDTAKFGSFFTEDVEFYHDKSGLTISRRTQVENLARRCQQQAAGAIPRLRRELVAGSMEVYPLVG
jgi:hypothetical protein